jgi:hypothetical protein
MKKAQPRKKQVRPKKPVGTKPQKTARRNKSGRKILPIDHNVLPPGTADFGFILFRCYAKSMNADAAHEECCRQPGLRDTTAEQVERAYQEFEKLCRVLAKIQQNPPKSRS